MWKEHCKLNCNLTKERKTSERNTRRKISTPKKQQLTQATIMETTNDFLLASTMAQWVILLSNGKKGGDDKVTDFESERDSLEAKAKNVSEVEKIKEMGEHWEEKDE